MSYSELEHLLAFLADFSRFLLVSMFFCRTLGAVSFFLRLMRVIALRMALSIILFFSALRRLALHCSMEQFACDSALRRLALRPALSFILVLRCVRSFIKFFCLLCRRAPRFVAPELRD